MLSEIKTALESVAGEMPVYYGQAGTLAGEDLWDYVVFFRNSLVPTGNKRALAESYTVAIVQEEFIEDGLVQKVIDAMCGIPGMRFQNSGGTFEYTTKPNTSQVIEVLLLGFVRPSKVCHG